MKIGESIMRQERPLRELKDQSKKLLTFVQTAGREKDAAGAKKRIATVLKALARDPLGTKALSLQKAIINCPCNKNELEPVLNQINKWIETALTIEQEQTASERLYQAWQEGKVISEFIPLSE